MCSNELREIGFALQEYRQHYGSFPPAYVADARGKPLFSWRVIIQPFLDHDSFYKAFHLDQAWDSAANRQLSQMGTDYFSCPADGQARTMTNYVAVVGPNTAWPGAKGSKLADFKDPSKTILLVEVANSGIHWAEPRDLYIGQMAPGVNPAGGQGISSEHKGGANVLFADGHVEFLPDDIDPKKFARMLEINPAAP